MSAVNNNGRGQPRILQTYRKQYDNTGTSKLTATKFKISNDPCYALCARLYSGMFIIPTDFIFVLLTALKGDDRFIIFEIRVVLLTG